MLLVVMIPRRWTANGMAKHRYIMYHVTISYEVTCQVILCQSYYKSQFEFTGQEVLILR